ncbi:uncharacterized protein LOC111353366 [Spodoptera litura]|uniref:Uncharacterized protein LOC111353366 n=1 Tax=Spodoptera litura TaxID=69820 RepID=A0A9J7E566_SPOLT|nr:uncharacterized protein LOC111353366 [Spodoptera litura]
MVNGNYVLYGDRPSSESEIVDDHVHTRSNERKNKRKMNRTANELQHTLNLAQLDNETDSVKYEKKIKEPRLLRYVPTTEVEENFVTEKFETYDLKPTEERPRRYAFTKKPKNPSDGSVNYAYSRSSSSCSSPNGNLPTISEHGEQYGTYRVRAMPSPTVNDLIAGYDTKLDKYFSKPRDVKPFSAKGSHPDSLYRVATDNNTGASKVTRVLRVLRWPVALIAVCIALAIFVYFLMPDNLESASGQNGTYWEPVVAGHRPRHDSQREHHKKKPVNEERGSKPSEIDFYDAENNKNSEISSVDKNTNPLRKLPIFPVFPTHITPEVQYGNEKADSNSLRTPKQFEVYDENDDGNDSTLKPHITQKPEKPVEVYFNEALTTTTEVINRAETINDFTTHEHKQVTNKLVAPSASVKMHQSTHKEYTQPILYNRERDRDQRVPLEVQEFYSRRPNTDDVNFTSGHSKLFGISIEDAEKMKSTTQSSLYNTRVSPTLPTWRDGDDTTTKKYPSNAYSEVQCRSPRLALCRGVLPYDLAGAPAKIGNMEITTLLPQIDYLVSTNCSDRVKHFMCALLEPECNAPPYPLKMPCYSLCKAILDSCDGQIPAELTPAFNCKQYARTNCVEAKTPCYPREFGCGDGSCVPRDWICDGTKDCSAGEDEATCVQCEQAEYRCRSGGCILKRWLCDGYSDCPDGDDEHIETCGTHSQHTFITETLEPSQVQTASDIREPGEESAGSAPAPAIRRPNRVPIGQKVSSHRSENESSKELLITSDSNNGLKRNYTRRPLPPRLSHYHHSHMRGKHQDTKKEITTENNAKEVDVKKSEGDKPTQKTSENESIEDVNMGDLGFFDEFEKEGKEQTHSDTKTGHHAKPMMKFGVPPPNPTALIEATKATHLDKQSNNLDRVIDGAGLLRKAQAAQAAEAATDDSSLNETYVNADKDDTLIVPAIPKRFQTSVTGAVQPANVDGSGRTTPGGSAGDFGRGEWTRAHTSPCPSGELRCVDGRCITLAQLCDGTIDCSDHADEDNCYT